MKVFFIQEKRKRNLVGWLVCWPRGRPIVKKVIHHEPTTTGRERERERVLIERLLARKKSQLKEIGSEQKRTNQKERNEWLSIPHYHRRMWPRRREFLKNYCQRFFFIPFFSRTMTRFAETLPRRKVMSLLAKRHVGGVWTSIKRVYDRKTQIRWSQIKTPEVWKLIQSSSLKTARRTD